MVEQKKIINLLITLNLLFAPGVVAQTEVLSPQPHPLETNTPDSLLPQTKRPLNAVERSVILQTTQELDQRAQIYLKAGKDDEAFSLWYRELKLQRALGLSEELIALTRVGSIAWEKSRTVDVQAIERRLEAIEPQLSDPQQLTYLAQAYQQIRFLDESIRIYEKILTNAQAKQDFATQEIALKNIGQLHLARFDYNNAATTYEQLLALARDRSNTATQELYLQQLAEIYTQASQPEKALAIKEQLVENYLKNQQQEKIPPLKISLGDDYQANNQPKPASENYQQAFELAWSLQQLATASEALKKLGELYRKNNQLDSAIIIYQQLLKVETQSYNYYGLMTTYDRIAQIYLDLQDKQNALKNFQKGLEIAKILNHQQAYFNTQIQQVKLMLNN